jgi:GNAT superfamily N-acetyltransferase
VQGETLQDLIGVIVCQKVIRTASETDVQQLHHLLSLAYPRRAVTADAIRTMAEQGLFVVEYEEDVPVGMVYLTECHTHTVLREEHPDFPFDEVPLPFAWLGLLCVHPEYRGKGIAKRLAQSVVEEVRSSMSVRVMAGAVDVKTAPASYHIFTEHLPFKELYRFHDGARDGIVYLVADISAT